MMKEIKRRGSKQAQVREICKEGLKKAILKYFSSSLLTEERRILMREIDFFKFSMV